MRTAPISALEVEVRGVVQGVGFRPFVQRLATRHGLGGWIRNESGAVRIFVEGPDEGVGAFLRALDVEAPPLTRIDSMDHHVREREGATGFRIVDSVMEEAIVGLPVSPDVAMCARCEAELLDPHDRRHRYPFITCTDCGPRFTIIESMPYDRARTTMRHFRQCVACLGEYRTPGDRRFHSETNSCPVCGPGLWLEVPAAGPAAAPPHEAPPENGAAVSEAARILTSGGIVAIRGLGGFHLAVDATDEDAVLRLRRRKKRDARPFAVMVATLDEARLIGEIGPAEADRLQSPARPVVLLRAADRPARLAPAVAPGLDTVGVMLAYTPLHRLLLDAVDRPLVMTSGNLSDEPICTGNDEARERLGPIADGLLLHDRDIVARYDDSVVRMAGGATVVLRRSRGLSPLPVRLPVPSPRPLLAFGGHLKNTFALVRGRAAYVSQHMGDLGTLETLEHFTDALQRFRSLFQIEPEVAACDLHPGYLSTRLAEESGLERVIAVQHHHAHVAAVLAEHGRTDRVVGLAFDGTGWGEDGRVWGAEALVADLANFQRLGRLRYAPLPGGERAVRQPWRTALGYLSLEPGRQSSFRRAFVGVRDEEMEVARRQAEVGLNAPLASSMGRLFDAAAAVLGVRSAVSYDGQAPMELEALAGRREAAPLPFPIAGPERVMDPLPLLAGLGDAAQAGGDPADLAASFHESVAATAAALAGELCEELGIRTVALGGGCFQNARLLVSLTARLRDQGLDVLTAMELPPGDGGISYGQAAVAATRLDREERG